MTGSKPKVTGRGRPPQTALDVLADPARTGVFIKDAAGRYRSVNRRFARLLGRAPGELVERHDPELFGEQQGSVLDAHDRAARDAGHPVRYQEQFPTANGMLWLACTRIPLQDAGGQYDGTCGIVHELADHDQVSELLHERDAALHTLTDLSPVGILRTDPGGKAVYLNPRCAALVGCRPEQCLGNGWQARIHDDDRWRFDHEWKHMLGGDRDLHEAIRFVHPDGTTVWVTISTASETDSNGRLHGFIATLTDISELKRTQEDLQHQAHYDPLTHLPNRLLLAARLDHAIQRCRRNQTRLAVIFLDLDRFKFINDSLGHAAGDRLLQQVARRLQDCVRQDDTVARLGGDEFILLIEDVNSAENATFVAEKIINALIAPVSLDAQDVLISTSMGICIHPEDGDSADTLLRNADAAMYDAKQAGRNGYRFYTRHLTLVVQERLRMENALRHAVDRDELRLVFQPQYDLQDSSIVGVEVLLRWQHPQRGLLVPHEFMHIAEDNDLVRRIGRWVRKEACTQASAWLDAGLPLQRIAINVAATEVRQPGFTNELHRLLIEHGLPAAQVELEVTESLVMDDSPEGGGELQKLRALGVSLTIDDFGTGYSSLSHLKQLPVDCLKIDRSFVRDIPDGPNDMAITRAIIALGHSLGMRVTAEGVETAAQRDFLRREGCEAAQGHWFSKPLTIAEMEELLRDNL